MDREKVIKGLTELKKYLPSTMWKPINDASAILKYQNGLMLALEQSNAVNGYLNAEVERLNGLLKEQENANKRNPVIVCPHCGKRVK